MTASAAESFAVGVRSRYNAMAAEVRRLGTDARELTGAEVALVLAIVKGLVEACDALNPGWRSHPWVAWIPIVGRPRPDPAAIRSLARAALEPDEAPAPRKARRDRAAVLAHCRARSGRVDAAVEPELMADAILGEVATLPDAEIRDGLEGLKGA